MRDTGQGANFMVVLIGLVLIFKDSLRKLVKEIFDTITKGATDVSTTD